MERLTDSMEYCDRFCDNNKSKCPIYRNCINQQMYEKLKEYEDLEEQGKLLKLPCKVGDTLYSVSYKRKCREYGELIGGNMECFGCREDCRTKEEYFIKEVKANLAMIGNLIEKPEGFLTFLTLQEAELALKEVEGKK